MLMCDLATERYTVRSMSIARAVSAAAAASNPDVLFGSCQDFLRRQLRRIREQIWLVQYRCKLRWDEPKVVLIFEQFVHGTDSRETLFAERLLAFRIQDVRRDDGRQVLQVHLAARLFVDVREGRDPLEKHEQRFHRIAMSFRQQAAHQMQSHLALLKVLNPC